MNHSLEKLYRFLRWFLMELDRGLKVIVRRLGDAQGTLTEALKQSLPTAAQRKFAVAQRVAAKMVDLLIVGLLGVLLPTFIGPILGPIAGFIYSILGDGFSRLGFKGQSVGKRLMGLRVKRADGGVLRLRDAFIRNLPVGVATFFAIIPPWGWILCILVGVPLMLIEVTLMLRLEGETRLGDIMAGTRVVTES